MAPVALKFALSVVSSTSIATCFADILASITALTSKDVPFAWTPECQRAFETMKGLIAEDVLLRYPDPNSPSDVYTDASDLPLGAVIK